MSRPAIPKQLQHHLLYEHQYVCAVCQSEGCHIHHIDQNNTNNTEENLVVLCVRHHNEAHTKRDHAKNLDSSALRDAKGKWISQVKEKREKAATVTGQKEAAGPGSLRSIGLIWGYINHQRVIQMVAPSDLDSSGCELLDYCRGKGIVDSTGIIVRPDRETSGGSALQNTVYDWFDFGDDQRLHLLYTKLVDEIGRGAAVVHLEPQSWSPEVISQLIGPGSMVFVNRPFHFKVVSSTVENDHVRCRSKRDGVTLEFFVDTRNMFGTTSITVSFTGHKSCAALVLVKSIDHDPDGGILVSATPIALGVGFEKRLL